MVKVYRAKEVMEKVGITYQTLIKWSRYISAKHRYWYPAGYGNERKYRVWSEKDIIKLLKRKEK